MSPKTKTIRKSTLRFPKSNKSTKRKTIPVAYTRTSSSYATLRNSRDGSATLTTREIFPVSSQPAGLSLMLPMTPTKWAGTRSASLSQTYASHRPLHCVVSWEPAVGTSTSGSIAVGTVFAGARLPNDSDSFNSLANALAATNGGFMTSIWNPSTKPINLGRNLRANQFPLFEVSADDIPFWICVATSDTSGNQIGYLTVETKFTLRNPLVGSFASPVIGSGEVSIQHDPQQNVSKMTIPQSRINRVLSIGADYAWTFARNLFNASGSVITSILSPIIARLSGVSGSVYEFTIDNNIGTQQALGYIIGQAPNF